MNNEPVGNSFQLRWSQQARKAFLGNTACLALKGLGGAVTLIADCYGKDARKLTLEPKVDVCFTCFTR